MTDLTDKLCDDECDLDQCPGEPCHCEYGMEILRGRAELRADLARDNANEG
jgi:hypothetical protein